MPSDEPQIEVIVEFDEFIAGRELVEIIEILDEALWDEIEESFFDHPFGFRYRYFKRYDDRPPPLFCIHETTRGSIHLTGAIGIAAATYCYNRFKKGFRGARIGLQIERLGAILGDRLEDILKRINEYLSDYTAEAKERRTHIKSVTAVRKRPDQKSDKKG